MKNINHFLYLSSINNIVYISLCVVYGKHVYHKYYVLCMVLKHVYGNIVCCVW